MANQVPETPTDRFSGSGLPNYLEWYLCFHDPARDRLVDGLEYHENRDRWDEKQLAKWRYFYRVVPSAIGRPQRRRIRIQEILIAIAQSNLAAAKARVAILSVILGLPLLGTLWGTLEIPPRQSIHQFLVFLTSVLVFAILIPWTRFVLTKRRLQREVAGREGYIGVLRGEIEQLVAKCPHPLSSEDEARIESWLTDEVQAKERECLGRVRGMDIHHDDLFGELLPRPEETGNPHGVQSLLVKGWAPLQPSTFQTPSGRESSGLERVIRELGPRTGTFRTGSQGQLMCRVWYLQFVFLLRKNICVSSFFYDFVQRRHWGLRNETFQYNHIANFSISDIDLTAESALRTEVIPSALWQILSRQDFSAFTVTASSGSAFRCILVDENVTRSLNHWFEAENLERALQEWFAQLPEPEREPSTSLGSDDRERIREQEWNEGLRILKDVTAFRRELETGSTHWAHRVLQRIRDVVETYVQRVETTTEA